MCSLIRRTRAPHMESQYKLQHQLQRVSAAKLRSPRGRALGAWRSLAITLACSPRHHARIVLCIALALALAVVATVLLLRSVLLIMRCVLLRVSGPPLVVGLDLLLDLLLGRRMLVGHLPPASLLLDLHHLDLLLQLLLAVAAVLGLAVSQDGVVLGVLLVLLQERDSVVPAITHHAHKCVVELLLRDRAVTVCIEHSQHHISGFLGCPLGHQELLHLRLVNRAAAVFVHFLELMLPNFGVARIAFLLGCQLGPHFFGLVAVAGMRSGTIDPVVGPHRFFLLAAARYLVVPRCLLLRCCVFRFSASVIFSAALIFFL